MARWKLEPKMIEKSWKKWQSWNPNWQPKKGISLFIKQCEDWWIEQANKRDIEATYLSLVNMTLEELKVVWEDKKQPIIVRKLAEFIVKAKDINVIETMLDRWIWKSMPKDNEWNDKEFTFIIKA